VSEQVWTFYDFLPTMAEVTGQKLPAAIDGVSILPAIVEGKPVKHPPLYFEFHEGGFFQAARIGDWKAVRHGVKQSIELYDLKADLAESRDVAAKHPEIIAQFADFLRAARTESKLWPIRDKPAAAKKATEKKAAKANQP
jgi:arylsulfatase A-like enzyme